MTDISKEAVLRLALDCDQAQRDHDQETYEAHLHHDCAKTLRALSAEVERLTAALATARDDALEEAAARFDEIAEHDWSGIHYSSLVGIPISNYDELVKSAKNAENDAAAIRAMKARP